MNSWSLKNIALSNNIARNMNSITMNIDSNIDVNSDSDMKINMNMNTNKATPVSPVSTAIDATKLDKVIETEIDTDNVDIHHCALCKKPIDQMHWDEDQASVIMICCGHFLCTSCDGPLQDRKRSQAINRELVQTLNNGHNNKHGHAMNMKTLRKNMMNGSDASAADLSSIIHDICHRAASSCPVCNATCPSSARQCIQRLQRLQKQKQKQNKNHHAATHNLGRVYARGSPDGEVAPDDRLASAYFQKAAEGGNAHSQAYLGDLYYAGGNSSRNSSRNNGGGGGGGVKRCNRQAKKWYQKAADQGHARGLYGLARLHRDDRSGSKGGCETAGIPDLEKAMEYLKLAAEQDYPPAVRDYAMCLQNWNCATGTAVDVNVGANVDVNVAKNSANTSTSSTNTNNNTSITKKKRRHKTKNRRCTKQNHFQEKQQEQEEQQQYQQQEQQNENEMKAQEWFLRGARNELLISPDAGFQKDIAFCQYQSAKHLLSKSRNVNSNCNSNNNSNSNGNSNGNSKNRNLLPYALFWANRAARNGNPDANALANQCKKEARKKCAQCGKPNPKSACRGCNAAAYCDSACQKLHWNGEFDDIDDHGSHSHSHSHSHKDICQAVSKELLLIENKENNIHLPYAPTECSYCGIDVEELKETKTKLRACSRCGEAWYCGEQCQRMHWKGIGDGRMCAHKCECNKKNKPQGAVVS